MAMRRRLYLYFTRRELIQFYHDQETVSQVIIVGSVRTELFLPKLALDRTHFFRNNTYRFMFPFQQILM